MKEFKWTPYFWKLIWLVGLIILAITKLKIAIHFDQLANDTFNFIPILWSNLIISIIFGMYLAFIFVKKWSFKINQVLLWCVAIPCILIALCYPIIAILGSTFEYLSFSFIPYWLIRISDLEVFGITAGLALILSIFNTQVTE